MAWVAVDLDGVECIFNECPVRKGNCWDNFYEYSHDVGVKLPKGSIAKLIGRELTWNDEPVELAETKGKE